MITNTDRSRWFGASDTSYVVGNWDTPTFRDWWSIKCGFPSPHYESRAMKVGNLMEIPIIRKIERVEGRKIKLGKHPLYTVKNRLRVNYDGLTRDSVVEIKTSRHGFDTVPLNYWRQCQVLMYRTHRERADLYCYTMLPIDYDCPYITEIDYKRLKCFEIPYDQDFIEDTYLPRLGYLADCLRLGTYPTKAGFDVWLQLK